MARQPALFPDFEQQLLALILGEPDREWYRSDLARQLDVPVSSLQRPLGRLADAGVLRTERRGRKLFYQANPELPYYEELRALIARMSGGFAALRGLLQTKSDEIRVAFVFGDGVGASSDGVAGEEPDDVDLLVIGSIARDELETALEGAELGVEVNASLLTPARYAQEAAGWNPFLRGALEAPRELLVGTEEELERLAQRER